ncbi:MSMEG_0570 family nitrogen starvation response protein [Actinoplanes couchii]|uniref:MSMEG_0570 family protein n=1 Tax=Actinoplanes couchii TaxID=403638 RepID=A0ABQ3X820_9ACTN|nr:MSMEG_0570 family nitrogen starvation response protein [Actinoplanes couchii]MDR6320331.1 putative repeat protein (TIGR04042 family) [Actinoplanes couchii]GID54655.1 hypothetical protein Aco03nite_030590 [Actinoplanes couchii]
MELFRMTSSGNLGFLDWVLQQPVDLGKEASSVPERYVLVQWPDGPEQRIYSPSTVVEDYFSAGQEYPVGAFTERCREALRIASERVRAAYGFPCSNAARSIAQVERHAALHPAGVVIVKGIEA